MEILQSMTHCSINEQLVQSMPFQHFVNFNHHCNLHYNIDMKKEDSEILHIQTILRRLDLDSCVFIANWLSDHINFLETDISSFDKNIEQLNLSKRAYNVLKLNGIDTIQKLLKISSTWAGVGILKGAGIIVVKEIQQKITEIQNTNVFSRQ
jgi:DNA-directed RNA polymerase alpha subunit